jgi:hypothetical protein
MRDEDWTDEQVKAMRAAIVAQRQHDAEIRRLMDRADRLAALGRRIEVALEKTRREYHRMERVSGPICEFVDSLRDQRPLDNTAPTTP